MKPRPKPRSKVKYVTIKANDKRTVIRVPRGYGIRSVGIPGGAGGSGR